MKNKMTPHLQTKRGQENMQKGNKIIEVIKESRRLYLNHAQFAREKLSKKMNNLTAQQVQTEMMYIADMESRAYALSLLLEELEVL